MRTVLLMLAGLLAGCQTQPARPPAAQRDGALRNAQGISASAPLETVEARVAPPVGWALQPLERDARQSHQYWHSPSGDTAYGVIRFPLPIPVPPRWLIPPFVAEMKASEGDAALIGQPIDDKTLPGARFVVEGGRYKMRINLIVQGFRGWAIYAGTLRARPVNPAELELAERSRDATRVGIRD